MSSRQNESTVEQLLSLANLCDRYEVKARLIPGVLVTLPLVFAGALFLDAQTDFWSTLGLTSVTGVVLAVALSHLSAAAGRLLEKKHVEERGGLPTELWLRTQGECPRAASTIAEWKNAVSIVTGFHLPTADEENANPEESHKQIHDAIVQLRNVLRDKESARLVRIANEDYGFARNLAGLRWVWAAISALCLLASILGCYLGANLKWGIAGESVFLLVSCAGVVYLPRYVELRSERYTEALFAAAVAETKAIPGPQC